MPGDTFEIASLRRLKVQGQLWHESVLLGTGIDRRRATQGREKERRPIVNLTIPRRLAKMPGHCRLQRYFRRAARGVACRPNLTNSAVTDIRCTRETGLAKVSSVNYRTSSKGIPHGCSSPQSIPRGRTP